MKTFSEATERVMGVFDPAGLPGEVIAAVVPPCDLCGQQQTVLGAIEFGPPEHLDGAEGVYCRKRHVCAACYSIRHNTGICVKPPSDNMSGGR